MNCDASHPSVSFDKCGTQQDQVHAQKRKHTSEGAEEQQQSMDQFIQALRLQAKSISVHEGYFIKLVSGSFYQYVL
jgi:hypothetical protein